MDLMEVCVHGEFNQDNAQSEMNNELVPQKSDFKPHFMSPT
jgi:hypothetical protein